MMGLLKKKRREREPEPPYNKISWPFVYAQQIVQVMDPKKEKKKKKRFNIC